MPVRKNHDEIKSADYKKRKSKKFGEDVLMGDEIEKAKIDMNRYKAQPVENYQPLFKALHEQHPTGKRY